MLPGEVGCKEDPKDSERELVGGGHLTTAHCCTNVNNMEAHVNEPNEDRGKDHGEQAQKEAH